MHTRRIATFLLGAWMAGCLGLAWIEIQNLRSPALAMNRPTAPVSRAIQSLGQEQVRLLLRHLGAQENRRYAYVWEQFQILLGLALAGFLFRATQKRVLPLCLCGSMLALVLFQHIAATPELAFQGPETDFPPGSANVGLMARVWALQQVYAGTEIVKLVIGGILAGYLFVFRAPRRKSKEADDAEPASLRRRRVL